VAATGQLLCGWLDRDMQQRVRTRPYGTAPLGQEAAFLPVSGTGTMPHALLSAPSTTPDRWFLGFEDLSGGGDRDFNDAVFMLRAPAQPGWVRSRTLTSPDPRCALSRVRFQKYDYVDSGCSATAFPIDYAVATDCGTNPTPTWKKLTLAPGWTETTVDVSSTPGSELCWKAELPAVNGACRPTLTYVDMGYEATVASP